MKRKNFFIVPNQIFELGLKPKAFVVYCCLLRQFVKANADGQPKLSVLHTETAYTQLISL